MLLVLWHKSGKKTVRTFDKNNIETIKATWLHNVQHPIGDPFADYAYRVTIVDSFYPDSQRILWDTDTVIGIGR